LVNSYPSSATTFKSTSVFSGCLYVPGLGVTVPPSVASIFKVNSLAVSQAAKTNTKPRINKTEINNLTLTHFLPPLIIYIYRQYLSV
jgi:hypothetical protein